MEIDSSKNNTNNIESLFCFVDGCFTTSTRNKNLGFHQFPPNKEKQILRKYKNGTKKLVNTRQLWIEALNIEKEGTTVIGKMRVCSLHFSKNDFILKGKDVKKPFANLKRTAIPRRNLPLRKNSKLSTRLQVRGFNRLKWRGRLAFQDLDARVPMSRNPPIKNRKVVQKFEGGVQENVKKSTEVVEERKENEEEEECMEVVGFSLASLEDGTEKFIGLDGEPENTEKDQVTSEFIIKEEPLSDNEEEIDEWTEENIIAEVERSETENQGSDWTPNPPPTGDNSQQQVITTQSVLHDLESSGDEQEMNKKKKKKRSDEGAREEQREEEEDINKKKNRNDEEAEEEQREEEEEDEIRDRPCKWCGKRDCRGHNGEPQRPAAFVCVVCNELFQTPAQLDAHSERHDEEMNGYGNSWHDDFAYRNSKDLECKICGKHFATKTVLKEHVSRHVGDKLHVCLLCGRQFRHKINLVVHVNAHTIVRNFKCPQCPMTFGMRVDLEDHRGMHAEYDHRCEQCGAGFASQRALWTHRQVHTRRTAAAKKKKTNSNSNLGLGIVKKSSFPCRVCSKVLSTKNTLREHMMIHSGEKPHECMLCGKLIRHKANFIIHVQSHSMRRQHLPLGHFCDLCENDFASKAELRRHQVEEHSGRPVHKCIICAEEFLSEEGLKDHVEEGHEGVESKGEEEYGELFRPPLLEGFSVSM